MKVIKKIRNFPLHKNKIKGWTGRRLRIELERNSFHIELISEEYCRTWLGGRGFNASVLLEETNDPLCIAAGPLSGTMSPFLGPVTISGIPDANVNFQKSNFNQNRLLQLEDGFAAAMKYSGFDQIIITGKSERPVVILIDPDYIEIREAENLWGLGTVETFARIRYEELDQSIRILTIGPIAENGIRSGSILNSYTELNDKKNSLSLLGDKNLKAIIIRGTGFINIADPQKFAGESLRIFDRILNSDISGKNIEDNRHSFFSLSDDNSKKNMKEAGISKKPISCWSCPAECGMILKSNNQKDHNAFCLESEIDYLKHGTHWPELYKLSDLIQIIYMLKNLGISLKSISDLPFLESENIAAEIFRFTNQWKSNRVDHSEFLDLCQRIGLLLKKNKNNSEQNLLISCNTSEETPIEIKLLCLANLIGGCSQAIRFPHAEENIWEEFYKGLFKFATGIQISREEFNMSVQKVLEQEEELLRRVKTGVIP